jgi:ketosteroid isomerase-like protein
MNAKAFTIVAAIAAAGCATTPRADTAGAEAAIREVNRQLEQGVATKNAALIAQQYATDAVFMPPNAPAVRGRADIQRTWSEFLALPGLSLRLTPTINVATSGEMATDVGTYTLTWNGDAGQMTDRGKYLVSFIRLERNGESRTTSSTAISPFPRRRRLSSSSRQQETR